jgi:hypothetical protein
VDETSRCVQCTYKKQEVKTLSTGTPEISFEILRGILATCTDAPLPGGSAG